MRGIKLNLSRAGNAELDFTKQVETASALAQNAAVLVVTKKGSSMVTPTKGTNMQLAGAQGLMFNLLSSQHHLNFASLDVLSTLRDNQNESTPIADQINNVVIEADIYGVGQLRTNLVVTAQNGVTVGTSIIE